MSINLNSFIDCEWVLSIQVKERETIFKNILDRKQSMLFNLSEEFDFNKVVELITYMEIQRKCL